MENIFLCLGGTGTQIGYAIGTLYPLLKEAGITDKAFKMFVIDKDTGSGSAAACRGAAERYKSFMDLLPFQKLEPYDFYDTAYQEMQEATGLLRNKQYTVMNLIGNDAPMKELASMCWTEEKRGESLRDGNNRDPSRGSVDVHVCLAHFRECCIYKKLDAVLKNAPDRRAVRVVILGGATGGMGSSLIVPLAREIRSAFAGVRIDLVVLGTYFAIPRPAESDAKVDNIGESNDSFFRVHDQLQELHDEIVDTDWRVYYAAIPAFDNIAGEFHKNRAEKRGSHLIELTAATAAFQLADAEPGFYGTVLDYGADKPLVSWKDIPLGTKLHKPALDFIRLISIAANGTLQGLSKSIDELKKDVYVKKYVKKPANKTYNIAAMKSALQTYLTNVTPFVEFWDEVERNSRFGAEVSRVCFFPDDPNDTERKNEDMKTLLLNLDRKQPKFASKMPTFGKLRDNKEMWNNFVGEIEYDKRRIATVEENPDELLRLMLSDIYATLKKED